MWYSVSINFILFWKLMRLNIVVENALRFFYFCWWFLSGNYFFFYFGESIRSLFKYFPFLLFHALYLQWLLLLFTFPLTFLMIMFMYFASFLYYAYHLLRSAVLSVIGVFTCPHQTIKFSLFYFLTFLPISYFLTLPK